MRIEIEGKYVLKNDGLNFMLCKSTWNKKQEQYDDKPLGYYQTIEQALQGFKDFRLKSSDAKTWSELRNDLEEINSRIKCIGDQLR